MTRIGRARGVAAATAQLTGDLAEQEAELLHALLQGLASSLGRLEAA